MAIRTPLILNQVIARVEELALGDTFPGSIVEAYGGKNLLINGDFGLWQRGPSFTSTFATGGIYCADRWMVNAGTGGATLTVASNQLAPSDTDKVQCLTKALPKFTLVSSNDVGHYALLEQRIENAHTLSGKNAFVSFRVFLPAGVSRYIAVELMQDFKGTLVPAIGSKKYLVNPGWNTILHPVSVPSTVGKTAAFGHNLDLAIWFSGGSNWNYRTDNLGPQPSGEIYLSDMQVEEGTSATPFENRHPSIELVLCQRYYEKSYNLGETPGAGVNQGREAHAYTGVQANTGWATVRFSQRKRTTPAVTIYPANTSGGSPGNVAQNDGSITGAAVENAGSSGIQVAWSNQAGKFGAWFHWTADAEI